MAFSSSSYFAGIGTVVAAIGLGFACGVMITNNVVQPPNKLERAHAAAAPPNASTPSNQEQASAAKPAAQDAPSSPVVAAAPSPAANSQPAPQTQPAAPATPKIDVSKTDAATNLQEQPVPAAKGDEQTPAKSERTTVGRAADPNRAIDPNRDASRRADLNRDASRRRVDDRKPSDDRKFSERRRRQDQQDDRRQDDRRLDEATNVVRQMRPDGPVNVVVGPDDTPRYGGRPRHFELLDEDSPRVIGEPPPPPRFGFFGN